MKEGNDARISVQNAVRRPQNASPQYFYRPNMTPSQSKPVTAENSVWNKQQQLPVNSTHEIAIDINTTPYQAKPEQYNSSRIALDAKLMQAQTQFGASAVAMAAHRNIGTVHYGMS